MLTISTWLWGTKYSPEDVKKLFYGLKRNLIQDFRFVVNTDDVGRMHEAFNQMNGEMTVVPIRMEDRHLLDVKGCFARLRMFDSSWQRSLGLQPGERIASVDLDAVVTGPMDDVLDRPHEFMILQGANAANPCPYNGSLFMFRAGHCENMWNEFSLEKAQHIPKYEFPDDQGWFWHMRPVAPGWKVGSESGVYAFQKPGWTTGDELPKDAKLVVFPGWRSPQRFAHLPWIRQHWST